MAERRFYFWESYARAFALLDDAEAGRFIKACCEYAFGGNAPDFSDSDKLAFAWELVSGQITMSVDIGVQNSARGKQGGRPPKKGRPKSGAKSGAKTTALSGAKSGAESPAESDMNMNMNVGSAASHDGSAASPTDGGDSDEY